jgi:hypothetical protein
MSGSRAKVQRKKSPRVADYSSVDRTMIRDDVDWLYSMARSVSRSEWEGPFGIALAPQMARVVHESFDYVMRRRPAVAKPLERQLVHEIAAARHTIKLVDDSQRSVEEVLEAFSGIADKHSAYFKGGFDLAIFTWKGQPIVTSRSAEYQTLARVDADSPHGTSVVMGQSMVRVLEQGLGMTVPPWKRMMLPHINELAQVDEDAKTFYPSVYSSSLSAPEKDLLLTAESSLNALALVDVMAAQTFAGPVFRAQLLALVHAVSSITAIVSRHSEGSTRVPQDVRQALADEGLVWLVGQRSLRNRAMHYGIPSTFTGIASDLPMYGIVESICDEPFSVVKARLSKALALVAEALAGWRG